MGNAQKTGDRVPPRRLTAEEERLCDWYVVEFPKETSDGATKREERKRRGEKEDLEKALAKPLPKGMFRIPVFVAPARGRKTLGYFICELRKSDTVGTMRQMISRKMKLAESADVDIDDFLGNTFDSSLDEVVTLEELPDVVRTRFNAYPVDEKDLSPESLACREAANDDKGDPAASKSHDEAENNDKLRAPKLLCCPITSEVFKDAVITRYGYTYERSAALSLIKQGRPDPIADANAPIGLFGRKVRVPPLKLSDLFDNLAIEQAVSEWESESKPMSGSLSRSQLAEIGTTLFRQASNNFNDPPDYMLDPVSFEPLVDPVCTPDGNTFSRTTILEIIETFGNEPISQKPLKESDLVPNRLMTAIIANFYASLNGINMS